MFTPTTQIIITRRAEVKQRLGIKNTCLYMRVKAGLIPPPISLGGRAVGWLQHELDIVLAAMAAGKSELVIIKLVKSLVEQRCSIGGVV